MAVLPVKTGGLSEYRQAWLGLSVVASNFLGSHFRRNRALNMLPASFNRDKTALLRRNHVVLA